MLGGGIYLLLGCMAMARVGIYVFFAAMLLYDGCYRL